MVGCQGKSQNVTLLRANFYKGEAHLPYKSKNGRLEIAIVMEIRLKERFELKRGLLKPPKSALKTQSKRDKRARHIIVKDDIIFIYIYDKGFITTVNI
jgi:hypothetical protein